MARQIPPNRAPFPWFGGKAPAAPVVWQALGDVGTYFEPFAGSLAVLLARPSDPRHEIVNDADGFIVNAWRAIQCMPAEVARHCAWPLTEIDMRARWQWLRDEWAEGGRLAEELRRNPRWCDPEVAGWWLWGQSGAIGNGWGMRGSGPRLPNITSTGTGVLALGRRRRLEEVLGQLSVRLRDVRIACGDWKRSVNLKAHPRGRSFGVFLDPPYAAPGQSGSILYNHGDDSVSAACREWAIAEGERPNARIVLCGYEDEHAMPSSWRCIEWNKGSAGYGNRSAHGKANAKRERLWLSPHCLSVEADAELLAA